MWLYRAYSALVLDKDLSYLENLASESLAGKI